ncbi:MAG: type II secretion system protein [Oceanicoccus sp.]|uniref:type IV pilus modification PilV family protein n=1 Tax=Oceanicoccus sp. TaxID=2691044 RepID=UPI00261B0728|nr:type II secretion system protein [Oceanicoccus sp.]MCP3908392.1 type II secretion system protein [Oceanicoccus sp.]MDG1773972.1 type II secretion system protein [Oceanicoccus sp.]
MNSLAAKRAAGFTLVELVVGIVVMAIALTLLTSVFFSSAGRSVEPILQIRAAEFGQALMGEVLSKKFDHLTPEGGVPACTACTASGAFGPDGGENRLQYNDVDDYHSYCGDPGDLADNVDVVDARNETPPNLAGYKMKVCVNYDNFDGGGTANINGKLIRVFIYPPAGAGLSDPIVFSAYKGNY